MAMDVENTRLFREYAGANAESWYRYTNGPRGREIKNGDLRLVIGCDKVTSYGVAAISNTSQHRIEYLKFLATNEDPSLLTVSSEISTPPYQWEYSGLAEFRVGPDLAVQVDEEEADNTSNATTDGRGKCRNLCVFVRTLNLMLQEDLYKAIDLEINGKGKIQVNLQQPITKHLSTSQVQSQHKHTSTSLSPSSTAEQSSFQMMTQTGLPGVDCEKFNTITGNTGGSFVTATITVSADCFLSSNYQFCIENKNKNKN